MSRERRKPHRSPAEVFGLTRDEQLWYTVGEKRLQTFLADDSVKIHRVEVTSNSYGEYLFVTLSKQDKEGQAVLNFYGLGFHEYREIWIADRWYWYASHPLGKDTTHTLPKEEGLQLIESRRQEIESQKAEAEIAPSKRAILYSILADLTDEDGALVELDDLEDMGFDPEDF